MAGRDHLVIDKLFRGPKMAGQTPFRADHQVTRVHHAQFHGGVVGVPLGMLSQPAGRRAVAGLAAHPVIQLKNLRALFDRNVKRVAEQTLRGLVGRPDIQNPADAQRHRIRQHRESTRVLVLRHPGAVFVLQNSRRLVGAGLHPAVATAGGATAWPNVFTCYDG